MGQPGVSHRSEQMTAVATVNVRIERPARVGLSLVGINRMVKSLQEVGSWKLAASTK